MGLGAKPNLSRYQPAERAEILLTVGALTCRLGSARQNRLAMEKAKDLLSESSDLFAKLGDTENQAQAQNELGVCYWRAGEHEEASVIFNRALELKPAIKTETACNLTQKLAAVEILLHNYRYAERLLRQAESLAANLDNDVLRGNLYFHQGLAQKKLGEEENKPRYLSSAVESYEKALEYYQQAGHKIYVAGVYNNIGNALYQLQKFAEAHNYLDKALAVFKTRNNKGGTASAYETKARVFMAEGQLAEAEQAALASAQLRRDSDEHSLQAESLTTLGMVYARRGAFLRARRAFEDAYLVADRVGDKAGAGDALLSWLEELGQEMLPEGFREVYERTEALLQDSPRLSVQKRLRLVAKKQLPEKPESMFSFVTQPDRTAIPEPEQTDWDSFSLPTAVHSFEEKIIAKALKEAGGKVSQAAQLLGISHQTLSLQLQNRHQKLAAARKPRRTRADKQGYTNLI
jgi:tetratricopeptide (TPR) repeat protein